jgi:hypothetical protein
MQVKLMVICASTMKAVFASALPKAVGSAFRVKDDWQAPADVRRNTIKREAMTLTQVSLYAVLIDSAFKGLKRMADEMAQRGSGRLLSAALRKLESRQAVFLIVLSCLANILAETVSRLVAPRNIWKDMKKDMKAEKAEVEEAASNMAEATNGALGTVKGKHKPVFFTSMPLFSDALPGNPFQVASTAWPAAHIASFPVFPV